MSNLFDGIPASLPQEVDHTLLQSTHVRIERIISHGQSSPPGFWYEQDKSEWVLLICGAARLRFDSEESLELTPGSFINIPAHRRHRVEWTDPGQVTIWLAIHYG